MKPGRPHTPRCLVLLAARNGEANISDQLSSIRSQVNVEVDIYFSDDGSNDDTKLILTKFGCNNLNHNQERFFSACNNFLFLFINADIKGYDYIFMSDQDDIWLPSKLQHAIAKLRGTQSDCYSGSYYIFNKKKKKIQYRNKYFRQTGYEHLFRSPGPGFTYGFNNSAFAKIQSQIQNLKCIEYHFRWHDWLIYALAIKLELKWFIDDEAHALYRQHDQNDTGQNTSISGIIYRLKFLFGGQYRKEVLKICSVTQNSDVSRYIKRFKLIDRIRLIMLINKMRSSKPEKFLLLLWLILGLK